MQGEGWSSGDASARRGIALVVVSAVSFGCVAVLGKLTGDLPVASVLFWRWLLAFLALAPLALLARAHRPPRDARLLAAAFLVGAVGYALTSGVYFLALPHVQSALASFLLFLNPVFVAALSAALFRERLGTRGLGALALAIAGLALMTLAPGIEAKPLGVALALGSAVAYSLTIVASRSLVSRAAPLALAWVGMLGAATSFGVVGLASGSLIVPATATQWALIALLAVLGTAVAVGAFYLALPLIGAPRAALFSTLEPVSTVVVAFVVLQEPFTPVQLAGGVLVIAATALLATERAPAAALE